MKLRWLLLISILMLLSGCKEAPGSEPGTGANADSRPIFQDVETVSVDVMHSDRKFSDSTTIEPGHWEKAEELFLGPVFLKGEVFWWGLLDSNQWPHACEACALTS